jgi:predicted nucleotidyltransferase
MTYQVDRLFGSKTRVTLLSRLLMNADRTFYIRQLAKDTNIPYSMLYKEEKNLAALGVVKEEKRGKVTLVSVNKKLPYFAELKGLVMKTAGLASLVGDALSKLQDVRYALIYGSFASGEEAESSDVDVLIVGDVGEERILKAVGDIERKTGREINYILWSDREFRKRVKSKHHLLADIARKPVIMLIGEESEFRRAAKRQGHTQDQAEPWSGRQFPEAGAQGHRHSQDAD